MKKRAFTLAEVLITLGIIGIVAALTLPGIIENHKKKVTAESVKKAYSVLKQVQAMAENDYGDIANWGYRDINEINQWVQTYFEPYVKVLNSGVGTEHRNFGIPTIHRLDTDISLNNRNPMTPNYIVVTGGQPFAYGFFRGKTVSIYTTVYVYVNKMKSSTKSYAIMGKDVFAFSFMDDFGFIPKFLDYDRDELLKEGTMGGNSCNRKAGSGAACTAVIMKDGWRILNDYPWN